MSSYTPDELEQAVQATRERRRKVFAEGRGKAREDTISDTEPSPLERAQQAPEQGYGENVIPQATGQPPAPAEQEQTPPA